MRHVKSILATCAALLLATEVYASQTININLMDENGTVKPAGTIVLENTPYGLLLTPHLTGLTPGVHGFHVHEHASCDHVGTAAGSHLDPKKTGKHLGPYNNNGHLGDLPALTVDDKGEANLPVLAPRLKVATVEDHALMIHAGGDNYSDNPKLGGGGNRVACGTVSR